MWPLQQSFGYLWFVDQDDDSLTYSISGDDASYFTISNTSGSLYWTEAPDYETRTSYSIILTVSDGTVQTQVDLTINVTDVNENPSFTSSSTFSREENHAGNGSKYCCTVTVSHPQNSPTYLSLSGTDSDKMYIQGNDPTSGNHGRIIFNELVDYESDQLTYSVIVTAYDDNSNSSQQTITINITDHEGDDGS